MRGEPQKVGVGLRRMRELVEFYKRELASMRPVDVMRERVYEDTITLLQALDPQR